MNEQEPESPFQTPEVPGEAEPSPEPFEPGPAGLTGCGKPAIAGCLILVVLLGIGLLLLISQSPKLLRWTMEETRTRVFEVLPEDLEEGERERLDGAFDAAIEALAAGRVEPDSLGKLQRVAGSIPRPGERLSRQQVLEMTRLLEEIGGVGGEAPDDPPPGPEATSTPIEAWRVRAGPLTADPLPGGVRT